MILYSNFQIPYLHLIMVGKLNLMKKNLKMNILWMIYHTWDDCKWWPQKRGRRLQRMSWNAAPHHQGNWRNGWSFTHIDILYTLFHDLLYRISVQHELKPADTPKRVEFLSMASSLHAQWCFGVRYILPQWWSLVPCRLLHKHSKLSCLEFKEPSHFLNNVVASPKY